MEQLKDKAHLVMLGVGLLNLVLLPFWRLSMDKATKQAVGYPLLGLGLAVFLLSLLALKRGIGGEIEPVTELVTSGIYARLRHPMYVSFAISMLALDFLFGSVLGILVTFVAFLPSMVWRAGLEEQALARRFGEVWEDYAATVPSLLLWDLKKRKQESQPKDNRNGSLLWPLLPVSTAVWLGRGAATWKTEQERKLCDERAIFYNPPTAGSRSTGGHQPAR